MRITKLLFTLCFGVILSLTAQAQEQYLTVQKGAGLSFSLPITASELIIIDQPASGNFLEQVDQVGDTYFFEYTPAPEFTGADGFKLQEYDPFPPFNTKNYTFIIDVVESMVDLGDDFIRLDSDDTIIIDPTANDVSNASELTIEIAQVMHGSAELNEDNTITYTPSTSDLDYIVYSGKDMYGAASTATIYISSEGEQPTKNTSESFDMPSGSYQYITLPWTDYSYDGEDLEFGVLTQENDYVWKYVSNEGAEGIDTIMFVSESELEHSVNANVIAKNIDGGFVKDDIFYTAKNTQITFNVKDNDLNGQTVIESYSEGLYHKGNGEFVFTPTSGISGIFVFEYEANTGSEIESGTIKIVVGNHTPSSSDNYTFTTPKNQPRVIEYEVPLGTEFFEIEAYPSHGTIEVFGLDESVDVGCEEELQKMFALYTPGQDFVGADDITLRYFASDNNLPSYSTIVLITEDTDVDDACICVDNCVWPGDANGDGKVNVRDLLSIGRYIGVSGEPREDSPFGESFEGVQVAEWAEDQVNGKSVGFADANGDGIVSTDDISSVIDNYNNVNTLVSNDFFGVKSIPFYMQSDSDVEVGDVKEIEIYAGTSSYPAIDMRGVAFSVNLPVENVDVSSIKMEFVEDNFFVKGAPYADLMHVSDDAVVEIAGVKTNGIGSTGSGLIGVLSFIIIEDAEGIKPQGRNSSNSNNITVEISDILFEVNDGLQYSLPSSSINFKINSTEVENEESISVYPNPVTDKVIVTSNLGLTISEVQIVTITGESIANYRNIDQNSTTLNVADLRKGMYILNVTSENGTESIKMVKS